MIRRVAIAALWTALTACSPEPRSAPYFEAHPAEIDPTIKGCTSGVLRGRECENADLANAHRAADARMKLYRSAFEAR